MILDVRLPKPVSDIPREKRSAIESRSDRNRNKEITESRETLLSGHQLESLKHFYYISDNEFPLFFSRFLSDASFVISPWLFGRPVKEIVFNILVFCLPTNTVSVRISHLLFSLRYFKSRVGFPGLHCVDLLFVVRIYQISSFAPDWFKCVTWLNIPCTGNIPQFAKPELVEGNCACWEKYLKDNKRKSLHLA